MAYVYENQSGKLSVDSKNAICELLSGTIPDDDKDLTELIKEMDSEIKVNYPSITQGALNNIHGRWYEWLLSIVMWNYRIDNSTDYICLNLPNISSIDCMRLYIDEYYELINDFREKVKSESDVLLITSNPDYVIIDTSKMKLDPIFDEKITKIDLNTIKLLDESYKYFLSKCDLNDLVGYISIKTSLRPDRRLQLAHEGSLMKALYVHIQTRKWLYNPQGLKYYGFAREIKPADYAALKTVATHSIITVENKPQSAVDEAFEVNSLSVAKNALKKILI